MSDQDGVPIGGRMMAVDVIRLPRLARRLSPYQAAQHVEAWMKVTGTEVLHQAALIACDFPPSSPQQRWFDRLSAECDAVGDLCARIRLQEPNSVVLATALIDRWQAFRRESRYRIAGIPESWLSRPIVVAADATPKKRGKNR